MAREMVPLDVTNTPEVLRLAEDVARTGVPRVLRRNGDDLAVVRPAARSRPKRSGRSSPNAWLEGLIGIGESESDGADDAPANIHLYVAKATLGAGSSPGRHP